LNESRRVRLAAGFLVSQSLLVKIRGARLIRIHNHRASRLSGSAAIDTMWHRIIHNYSERAVKSDDGTKSIAFWPARGNKTAKMAALRQHLRKSLTHMLQ
jgi:hypothetical protein